MQGLAAAGGPVPTFAGSAAALLLFASMDLLREFLSRAPDDPLVLAGTVIAAWLPICAFALLCLGGLAALQNYLYRRPRAPRLLAMPPADVRPLVVRRTITQHRHANGLLDVTRVTLAIGAVVVFSLLVLATSGQTLLHALGR